MCSVVRQTAFSLFVYIASIAWTLVMTGICSAQADSESESVVNLASKPLRTVGVIRGDCKKCHPSEVSSWMKTTHFQSADLRLFTTDANTLKYAAALGIAKDELTSTAVCASCHGTQAIRDGQTVLLGGVSCEKCHGASGGHDGWLNRHQSYDDSQVIPRTAETEAHRQARVDDCQRSGMIRSENLYALAKVCYSCHLVNNEKLITAGHKLAGAFDFVSWSEGEVRHNFFMNRNENAAAPTLWQETTGNSAINRRRLKLVAGTLAQLEMGLRCRAETSNPVLIPQIGGMIASANGKMIQINVVSQIDEVGDAINVVTPLMATLFVSSPQDKERYTAAAERITEIANRFLTNHDGQNLSGLDAMLQVVKPHYSQQFLDKFRHTDFVAE